MTEISGEIKPHIWHLLAKEAPLTKKRLDEILDYNPDTGDFFWKEGCRFPGKKAGGLATAGYICISIKGKMYRAHRIAWFLTHGHWPHYHLDHIDGRRSNNCISNLREATPSQNAFNKPARGYSFCARQRRFRSSITINRKTLWLGYFDTAEEALAAYRKARSKHAGAFADDFTRMRT